MPDVPLVRAAFAALTLLAALTPRAARAQESVPVAAAPVGAYDLKAELLSGFRGPTDDLEKAIAKADADAPK